MLPDPMHFDQICRICLSTSEKLVNLFNSEEDIINLLVSMTAISISSNDDLPQNICAFCSHQIKTTHYFILKCQESDEKLRLSLQSCMYKVDDNVIQNDEHVLSEPNGFDSIEEDNYNIETDKSEDQPNQNVSCLKSPKKPTQDDPPVEIPKLNYCLECRFEFLCDEAFTEHMKTHQAQSVAGTKSTTKSLEQPSKPTNVCHICNKSFAKPKNLERHRAIHENQNKEHTAFECTVCGKQMKHINHFKIHMRSHRDASGNVSIPANLAPENKKQYLCSTCGRACTSRSNLAVHTRRHTGTMTNFCNICGKGYPRSTDLTIHMRKHTGERPFKCCTCGRGFARSDKLTIHIRTHTGERPYACNSCTRSFAQRNDLISHQRRNVCGYNKNKNETDAIIRDAT